MDIKQLKPNPNSRFKQGYFQGAKKYFGPEPIIYRSSLEYKFMVKMEMSPSVEKWSSEQIIIPYVMKEKVAGKFVTKRHNYHTDFSVFLKNGKKYIVEVKPRAQTPLNESQIRTNPVMYKNGCKWRAAMLWCTANNYQFKIINEEHLKTKIFD